MKSFAVLFICLVLAASAHIPLKENNVVNHIPLKNMETDNGFLCQACVLVSDKLKSFLLSERTEQEITLFVEKKVCHLLPSKYEGQCVTLVENSFPQIITYLLNKWDPEYLCQAIHACPTETVVPATNDWKCSACAFIVDKAEAFITETTSEQAIVNFVQKHVCKHAKSLRAQCDTIVENYGGQIIEWMVNRFNSKVICQTFKICPATNQLVIEAPSNGIWCPVCEEIVELVEEYIDKDSTRQYIEEFIDKHVCTLSKKHKAQCVNFVHQYGDSVIEWLVSKLDPKQMCGWLNVCDAPTAPVTEGVVECELCRYVLYLVDYELKDTKTDQEIIEFFENVCDKYFPSEYRTECDNYINRFGPVLIQYLINGIESHLICPSIGLCPAEAINKKKVNDCDKCKSTINMFLNEFVTELDVVDEICDHVPADYQALCKSLLPSILPEAETSLAEFGCKLIKACP
ncbi:hypothetical protein PCE1_002171 [Barthelona sp. PCE]